MKDFIDDNFRKFILPLYGRKMIVAAFAVAMYVIGVPWDMVGSSTITEVMNANSYIDAMYMWAILMVFAGGVLVDKVSSKDDDFARAEGMGIGEYLLTKTQEMFQPREFLGWVVVAVLFIVGVVDGEILFYASMGYVGINSGEALLAHFNSFRDQMKKTTQASAPRAVQGGQRDR